ncbi:MAG: hypothetical protein JKY96_07795 [Phycisphaerales bacterium]|nr:hypothetical protein [Phycisphaerales bacterium]
MCTVSIIPLPDHGYRVVHSRDEQRSRAPGTGPQEHRCVDADGSGFTAHWPVDPDAGGTWVACSPLGITHGIMNVNVGAKVSPTKSRGGLIPQRIHLRDAKAIIESLRSIDLSCYATFRYIAVGNGETWVAKWDGTDLRITEHPINVPICFASSGLGDDLVECRLPLFAQTVGADPTPDAQDRFHNHRWPDRPEFSVMMSREDARTVSVVAVESVGTQSPMMTQRTIDLGDSACDPIGAAMLQ